MRNSVARECYIVKDDVITNIETKMIQIQDASKITAQIYTENVDGNLSWSGEK